MGKIIKPVIVVALPIIVILIIFIGIIVALIGDSNSSSSSESGEGVVTYINLSDTTLAWLSQVTAECEKQGVSYLIPYVMAIIEVETKGTGTTDIMQCAESKGVSGFATAEESIEQGVKYLKTACDLAETYGIDDIWAVIQSYNFGTSYIGWLAQTGYSHSVDTAEIYSYNVVAPSLGNSSKTTYSYYNTVSQSYNKTYLYRNGGNFFYSELVAQYITTTNSSVSSGMFIWPAPASNVITSVFGNRIHPISGENKMHTGIDIGAASGTNILAADGGTVTLASYYGGYGNCIIIDHGNGYTTLYGHMSAYRVSVGATVSQGQIIGLVGMTGSATGPHLHFEVMFNGTRTDPLNYFDSSTYTYG